MVAAPGLSLSDQMTDCLRQLRLRFSSGDSKETGILKLTLFLRAQNQAEFQQRKAAIESILENQFGPDLPPFSIIGQPPDGDTDVAIEVMVLEDIPADVSISRGFCKNVGYSLVNYPDGKEVVAAGLTSADLTIGTAELSEISFSRMKDILSLEGMDFSHVVRQWNYIQNIVGTVPGSGSGHQSYQQFNDVRTKYYETAEWIDGYPSATGIGMNEGGIIIEFVAMSGPSSWHAIPLSNPLQMDAHRYTQKVLVGDPLYKEKKKTAPKFERAKLVYSPSGGQVYISGTAAIRGQFTVPEKDAASQTKTTLENILALISPDNLKKSGFYREINQSDISYLRVYVKREEDFTSVKKVCQDFLPDTPALFVVSDVCRPDLLMEIEGIMDFLF